MEQIQDRMPVILDYETAKEWIDPERTDIEELKGILEAPVIEGLDMYQVSDYVKNVRNDGEKCIERV